MKKLIFSCISIISGILIVLGIILIVKPKKTKINITSLDKLVTLELKKYKVSDYEMEYKDGNQVITFEVFKGKRFYDEVICKNEYFDSSLIIEETANKMCGYMIKDNRIFRYNINQEMVEIRAWQTMYYDGYNNYYISMPALSNLSFDLLKDESKYNIYTHFQDRDITFEYLNKLVTKFDTNLYKIEDGIIYLKGISSIDFSYSQNYLIKLYERNNRLYIVNA